MLASIVMTPEGVEVVDAEVAGGEWPSYAVDDNDESMARRCADKAAGGAGPGESERGEWREAYVRAMLTAMRPKGDLADRLHRAMSETMGLVYTDEPWKKEEA